MIIGNGHSGHRGITVVKNAAILSSLPVEQLDSDFMAPLNELFLSKVGNEPSKHVWTIEGRKPIPEIWVDSNEPVFNQKKHDASCLKNRRKRKKKK